MRRCPGRWEESRGWCSRDNREPGARPSRSCVSRSRRGSDRRRTCASARPSPALARRDRTIRRRCARFFPWSRPSRAMRTARPLPARGHAAENVPQILERRRGWVLPSTIFQRPPGSPRSHCARSGSPVRTGRQRAACRNASTAQSSPTPRRGSSPSSNPRAA